MLEPYAALGAIAPSASAECRPMRPARPPIALPPGKLLTMPDVGPDEWPELDEFGALDPYAFERLASDLAGLKVSR